MSGRFFKRIQAYTLLGGLVLGALVIISFNKVVDVTSTDDFCNSCHVHPHSTTSWKQSTHYVTASGIITHCVECHLPPKGEGYLGAKITTGLRDVYGVIFKDSASFNWEMKSRPDHAVNFAKDVSCVHCHVNIFPLELTHEGMDAHLYYEQQEGEVACIKCHLNVGHYKEGAIHASNTRFGIEESLPDTIYMTPFNNTGFVDFIETIPYSAVNFEMIAIPGGTFIMGSSEDDKFADSDEFPAHAVDVDSFFMGAIEVSWDEYMAYYGQTAAEGRTTDIGILEGVDGLTGATPPYGNPDQGWGRGKRPAITMTYYAAEKYCEWLSIVTEKNYRLPTEAEWEYAARGGTESTYFFEGEVKNYGDVGLKNKLFGVDTSIINSFVIYAENSKGITQLPTSVAANPFGLKNMLGNVAEFCSDIYLEDAYKEGHNTNVGISEGTADHVIRGGSFRSEALQLRVSNRDKTDHEAWMRTDPQIPKSLWWYSDAYHIGFRVVCENN